MQKLHYCLLISTYFCCQISGLIGPKALSQVCFTSSNNYAGSTSPRRVISGDFNSDGKPDLAVANFSFNPSNTLSIYLNTGTGTFGSATNYITGTGPSGITTGDFNGDGKLDLATANRQSNSVSILLGTGTGTFSAATNYSVPTNPQEITIGDFNGDGKLDLATANSTAGNTSILLGTGTGSFGAATNFVVGSGPNGVICKDFNGDSKLDLAFSCAGTSNSVNILLGTGTGSFGAATSYPAGTGPSTVTSADFNGDGKLDLAVGTSVSGNATVSIYLGTGTGSFGIATNFAAGGFQVQYIINSDFNGDGKLDVATANNDALKSVSVLLGDGVGNFGTPLFLITGGASTPIGITNSDFNGDSKMDIATSNYITNNVSVFLYSNFTFNPLTDTTRVCGTSATLDAGGGYVSYNWNTGATTQTITPTTSGIYKVTVTNSAGCSGSDSTYLSILNVHILQNDTTICRGATINLSIDTSWNLLATMPVTRAGHGSAPINGKIYLVLGDNNSTGQVDIYNVNSNSWTTGTNMPFPGRGGGVGVASNGKMYAIGGYSNFATNYTTEYAPSTNSWLTKAPMPTSRSWASGVEYGGKIYVTGGWPGNMNVLEIYDPLTNTWTTGASMPFGRENVNSMVVLNGKIYFIGGKNDLNTIAYSNVYVYNPVTNSWSTAASLPIGMFAGAAVTDGLKIYYIGGNSNPINFGMGGAKKTIYIYDPNTNQWTLSPVQLPVARYQHSANFYNGRLYVFGGADLNNALISESISTTHLSRQVLWSTGATTNTISVSPTQTTTYYATITNGITTCTDSVTVTVNPVATVNPVSNQIVCHNSSTASIIFSSPTSGGSIIYNWINNTSSIGLPASGTGNIASFIALNSINTPIVATITVTPTYTSGGISCIGTPTIFTITVNPIATVNPVSNQVVCHNSSTAVINFSSPTTGGSIIYNWINNTPSIGLPANGVGNITSFIALNTTNAPVTAIITVTPTYSNGGVSCVGTPTIFTITVNPLPSGSIITPSSTIICQGSTINLTASGGLTYQWFLNGVIIAGATAGTYNATQAGIYTVQLINLFGCTNMASNSIVLTLVIMPTADFSFDKYCAGISTNFTNLSNVSGSGAVSYSWSFGDGGISTQFSPTYTYTQPGNFIARLTVTPATCPSLANSISKNILVQSPPQNLRYTTLDALANRPYQLQARNITGSSYLWTPAAGLNTSTIINPIFNYDRQQQYFIRINTIAGCILTDTILVRVFKEKEIYVPGGFSPNGDGKNEKLTPILIGIQNLTYFKIFDRWGQLMYQTNRAGEGWDGIYRGVKQPFETYSWIAVGIDIDGLIIKRIGSSILLR